MKLAIISVTLNGSKLAERIQALPLGYAQDCFCKRERGLFGAEYDNLGDLLTELWPRYQGFIFIMATGIVVRSIAKLLEHKAKDPAVLCLDEKGEFVISLLSGHLGGANELAQVLSSQLGSTPVITTATDVQGLVAPDVLARKLKLTIESFAALRYVNAHLAAGGKIEYYLPEHLQILYQDIPELSACHDLAELDSAAPAAVVITDTPPKKAWLEQKNILVMTPKHYILGIGCRRGTSREVIVSAIAEFAQKHDIALTSIAAIASAWLKSDEQGLLDAAEQLKLPIEFFPADRLAAAIDKYDLQESQYVQKTLGIGNVCEAAALCKAKKGRLKICKTVIQHITIAMVQESYT